MRDVLRRNWRFWVALAEILVLTVLFAHYTERRDARTRQSLCAILDRIPERIDSGMDKARTLDHCGHPHPPTVFFGHPFPTPSPAPAVTVTPTPRPASAEAPAPAGATPAPAPTVTRTIRPSSRPTPSSTPTRHPPPSSTPTPTPSRTCVLLGHICA